MAEQHTLKDLVRRLAEERGIDLRGYKLTTLERRVHRRLQQLRIATYDEYLAYISREPAETARLLDAVLINVTRFFRDGPAWEALAERVLPAMFKGRPPGSPFRVWSAGCATGEEPYSVAILLCEVLGPRLKDYEIKIYATDHDENALNIARRGEYSPDALRGVKPEIKAGYFTGESLVRVVREVRRMVIFGRSNLLTDAPISHVDLLLCRNVLIYFDAIAQAHIMGRLTYALNQGGVLFLGKSELQLKRNSEFIPIDQRWHIFQRRSAMSRAGAADSSGESDMETDLRERARAELETVKLYYDSVLSTLEPGVLVIDSGDQVITENEKVAKMWNFAGKLLGKKLQETELWQGCPELKQRLEESRSSGPKTVRFDAHPTASTMVTLTIKPILAQSGAGQVGTLIYMENVTSRVTLQSTIEELETTAEELQSANEELETTNEELQSTNEELETTNEELQSTNEELETTNEELQSLNEELETTNEELSSRTRELDEVNARYSEMIERMPWPVLLVNDDTIIYMFNSAAKRLFGFANPSDRGIRLQELPLDNNTRLAIVRRHRLVSQSHKASSIRNCRFITNRMDGTTDVYFTPLSGATAGGGVIIIFQVERQDRAFPNKGTTGPQNRKTNPPRNERPKPAKKSTRKRR
ncbi:MAG TPA: CheR family methyltransferase [Candidatus Angelobacter sp.]|nr:CheR family methyltransferase [Candidatus Angelobacter sp.]